MFRMDISISKDHTQTHKAPCWTLSMHLSSQEFFVFCFAKCRREIFYACMLSELIQLHCLPAHDSHDNEVKQECLSISTKKRTFLLVLESKKKRSNSPWGISRWVKSSKAYKRTFVMDVIFKSAWGLCSLSHVIFSSLKGKVERDFFIFLVIGLKWILWRM